MLSFGDIRHQSRITHLKRRLLGPFQNDHCSPPAGRRSRIDVLHLVSRDSDEAFLIGIVPGRETAADDLHEYRMICFVDRVGAKGGDRTLHDCFALLRRWIVTVGELGTVGTYDMGREMT